MESSVTTTAPIVRTCKGCGHLQVQEGDVCQNCGASLKMESGITEPFVRAAGWKRLVAAMIDGWIVGALATAAQDMFWKSGAYFGVVTALGWLGDAAGIGYLTEPLNARSVVTNAWGYVGAVTGLIYWPLFEGSPMAATIGKWMMGLAVIDEEAVGAISRPQAWVRGLLRWVLIVMLVLATQLMMFAILGSSVLLWIPSVLLLWGLIMQPTWFKKPLRFFHDKISGTVVIDARRTARMHPAAHPDLTRTAP